MWYSGYLLSIVYQSGGKFQMRMYHQWIHQRPTWSHKMQVNTIFNKPRDWAKYSLCSVRLFFGFFLFSCSVLLRIKAVKAGITFYMTNKRTTVVNISMRLLWILCSAWFFQAYYQCSEGVLWMFCRCFAGILQAFSDLLRTKLLWQLFWCFEGICQCSEKCSAVHLFWNSRACI